MTNYEKLQKVLTELFQLDKAELDFGIYRIMNQKRDDVLDFLSNKLPKEVRTILEGQQQGDATTLKKELDNAIKMAEEFYHLRKSHLSLFRSMPDKILDKEGIADDKPISVLSLWYITVGHWKHHQKVLNERYF
jgi:hypothetical protein